MTENALIIGANGSIAQAIIAQLLDSQQYQSVYGVSRSPSQHSLPGYRHIEHHDNSTQGIDDILSQVPDKSLSLVVCCIGVLHDASADLMPEKKLEDLNTKQLHHYFSVNTVLPALWLSALPAKIMTGTPSHIVCLSARVASTADNRLGGWYGYRASKAALNSIVKSAQIEYRRRCPDCTLVLYHPGTVDSPLSEPFQKNVPEDKLFSPDYSVQQLLQHLSGLSVHHAPHYIDWQGKSIPW